MRYYLRNILLILVYISGALSLTISFIAIQRFRLEYNVQGKSFDTTDAVVYDTDALAVYITASIIFWLVTVLLAIIRYKLNRN